MSNTSQEPKSEQQKREKAQDYFHFYYDETELPLTNIGHDPGHAELVERGIGEKNDVTFELPRNDDIGYTASDFTFAGKASFVDKTVKLTYKDPAGIIHQPTDGIMEINFQPWDNAEKDYVVSASFSGTINGKNFRGSFSLLGGIL